MKAERRAARHHAECAAAERREQRRRARERGAAEGARRGCLICRRSDGGFTTEEHVIPESLGNTEKLLPPGVVCDRCNHEVCAPLDEALCSFAPVQMLRTMFQQPTKAGKLPSVRFDNGRLEAPRAGHFELALSSERWQRENPSSPGTRSFSFTSQWSNAVTSERLSRVHRALVKQALELAWLDSEERVLSEAFDRERSVIMEGGHHGYVATVRTVSFLGRELTSGMQYAERLRTSDGAPLLFFVEWLWGVPLIGDTLFPEPTQQLPDDFIVWSF
jgi:hypothetical protein